MKKLSLGLILIGALVSNTFAATQAITVPSGTMTNFPISYGSVKIQQIIVTTPGTNYTTNYEFIDTPTNWLVFTNSAYSNILSYATNYVTTWTNYYGKVNSDTNIDLVDITNAVAASTNYYPVRIIGSVPTNNATAVLSGVNYYFVSGLWVTNSGPGAATFTITYQQ